MMTGKNDAAAHTHEDSFLAGLIPQVTEHLAERYAEDFDAETGQARFEAWLAAHSKDPSPPAGAKQAQATPGRRPPDGSSGS